MRRFLPVLVLALGCLPSVAMSPDYFSTRDLIKEESASNAGDPSRVVYVGSIDTKKYFVVKWNPHLTIRSFATMVGFRDRDAMVIVLRKGNHGRPVAHIFVGRGEDHPFLFRSGDVV